HREDQSELSGRAWRGVTHVLRSHRVRLVHTAASIEGTLVTTRIRLMRLGQTPYEEAWRWQTETAEAVRNSGTECFALVEHPPVFTFGRRVRPEHLLIGPTE